MTAKQLKDNMNALVSELHNPTISNTVINEKQVIAKAVQLGMRYQEEKIKKGIDIIFTELHNK